MTHLHTNTHTLVEKRASIFNSGTKYCIRQCLEIRTDPSSLLFTCLLHFLGCFRIFVCLAAHLSLRWRCRTWARSQHRGATQRHPVAGNASHDDFQRGQKRFRQVQVLIVSLLVSFCPCLRGSDGAGRTGTYILVDMVLNKMAKGGCCGPQNL